MGFFCNLLHRKLKNVVAAFGAMCQATHKHKKFESRVICHLDLIYMILRRRLNKPSNWQRSTVYGT